VNLEEIDTRLQAQEDPRAFLSKLPRPVILDEIQNVPELFSYLQPILDEAALGSFILTGSHQFALHRTITQSLAGRTAVLTLLPLSVQELQEGGVEQTLDQLLLRGGYPRVYTQQIPPHVAYRDYLTTYIERDLREILAIRDLAAFQRFLKLCALRIGQLLNYESLATDVGISPNTIKQWLSVLEASYVIFRLPPWHSNLGKRLIKTPKLYFYDTGLASYLAGIQTSERLEHEPLRGQLFENLVVLEFMKHSLHQGRIPTLHFLRDQHGHEIDLLSDNGSTVEAVEIKSSQTFQPRFLDGINYFAALSACPFTEKTVIYDGEGGREFHGAKLVSWRHCFGR